MIDQQNHVRALPHCPNCKEPKSRGLLICWPCNSIQKQRNDGGYSPRLEKKLAAMEQALKDADAPIWKAC